MTRDRAEFGLGFAKQTGLPMQAKQGYKVLKMTYTDISSVADGQFMVSQGHHGRGHRRPGQEDVR